MVVVSASIHRGCAGRSAMGALLLPASGIPVIARSTSSSSVEARNARSFRSRRTCSGRRPGSRPRSIWPAATSCTARSTICPARARRSSSRRRTTTAIAPLVEAIAAHYRVGADRIVTAPAVRAPTSSRSPPCSSARAMTCSSSGRRYDPLHWRVPSDGRDVSALRARASTTVRDRSRCGPRAPSRRRRG